MSGIPSSTSAVCHGCRRAYSDESLNQPSAPIDAGRRGEAIGGDLTTGDLADDELWLVNHHALFYVTDMWGHADPRTQLSVCMMLIF